METNIFKHIMKLLIGCSSFVYYLFLQNCSTKWN